MCDFISSKSPYNTVALSHLYMTTIPTVPCTSSNRFFVYFPSMSYIDQFPGLFQYHSGSISEVGNPCIAHSLAFSCPWVSWLPAYSQSILPRQYSQSFTTFPDQSRWHLRVCQWSRGYLTVCGITDSLIMYTPQAIVLCTLQKNVYGCVLTERVAIYFGRAR